MSDAAQHERATLRRRLGHARAAVSRLDRQRAAEKVAENLAGLGLPRPGSRLGVYLSMGGELDTAPVIDHARRAGCTLYVPVITSFALRHMRFVPLAKAHVLRPNRWGIHEPEGTGISGRWLDLVLLPCVAFDSQGGRLGRGAGYYDRHFSFLVQRNKWLRPRLVGLAYELQHVAQLLLQPWDVPLWGVVTEKGTHGPAARQRHAGSEEVRA